MNKNGPNRNTKKIRKVKRRTARMQDIPTLMS